jgi:hypothetical protein
MDSRQWPDQLRHKLRQQNLPPAYIDRLMEELSEHFIDAQLEITCMDAQNALSRIGSAENIAAVATHEFRRQHFAGRHPYFTFIFGPIAFLPMLFLGLLFGPYCILATLESAFALLTGNSLPPVHEEASTLLPYWIACCYHHFFRFIPFALTAWIFCRWGQRIGMQPWAMVACGIVAVMAGATVSRVKPVDANSAEWMLMFGLAMPSVNQLFQFFVPLAVAAWLLRRVPQRRSPTGVTPNMATV